MTTEDAAPKTHTITDAATANALQIVFEAMQAYRRSGLQAEIPQHILRQQTQRIGAGGSPSFARAAQIAYRKGVVNPGARRDQEVSVEMKERTAYHKGAHQELLAEIGKLASQTVEGVNQFVRDYDKKFTVQLNRPIPDITPDSNTAFIRVMTHRHETPGAITQDIGTFEFTSFYHHNPSARSAQIRFQAETSKLNLMEDGEGFYPPAKLTPITLAYDIWTTHNGVSVEEGLRSAKAAILKFMSKYDDAAVKSYKEALAATPRSPSAEVKAHTPNVLVPA